MGQVTLPGNPPVEITLRRNARARRISLRVSALDGRVTLSMPQRIRTDEALAFAEEKADWIRGHLAGRQAEIRPAIGGTIDFEGQALPLVAGGRRAARMVGGAIEVAGPDHMVPARLKAFLKLAARRRLQDASARYAAALARTHGRITLRDTRSRWGSCTANGDLMYSWRLIMAPPEVLDYVAAHEVSHLVELNHSPAYWRVVEGICPGYAAARAWLRRNGHGLHRFRFDD